MTVWVCQEISCIIEDARSIAGQFGTVDANADIEGKGRKRVRKDNQKRHNLLHNR